MEIKATSAPWELVTLSSPAPDWTATRYVIRAPGAPGGVCVLIGTGDQEEEKANADLILAASIKRKFLLRPAIAAALRDIVLDYAQRHPEYGKEGKSVWHDVLSGDVINLGEVLNLVTQL